MILTIETIASERPPEPSERYDRWYAKALPRGLVVMGPRFGADFDKHFARQYEREQILDSAPLIGEAP